MSNPAIISVPVAEEEEPTTPTWVQSHRRNPSRKGKEKELPEPSSPWSANTSRTSSPIDSRPDDALRGPARTSSYPPVNDDEEETRRIQENLKRWEQAEMQRRKAARQSSVSSTPGGSVSIVENVTRRASLLWPGGRGAGASRHTHGRKTGSLASSSLSLGQHTQLPSTDDLPLTAIAATADTPRSSVDTVTNPGGYDTDSVHTITEADVAASRTKRVSMDDPFNPPEAHEQQKVNEMLSPFSDPPPPHGDAEYQTSALVGGELVSVSGSGSEYPIVVITSSSKPPPPRPLGLPPPKTPPPPIEPPSTSRRGTDGDDDEDPPKTRWWHEWLCGCGEGPDRGGDRQAGKTNPYE